jgi:hypothetical protein
MPGNLSFINKPARFNFITGRLLKLFKSEHIRILQPVVTGAVLNIIHQRYFYILFQISVILYSQLVVAT